MFVQYEETLLQLVPHFAALPIEINLYAAITPMLERALGIYFHTNYYVAKRTTLKQASGNVFYQRFVYDLISMFGINLFYIDQQTLEFLIRKVYIAISFATLQNRIMLRNPDDVEPAFTAEEYQQVIESRAQKEKGAQVKVKMTHQLSEAENLFSDVLDDSKYKPENIEKQVKAKKDLVQSIAEKKSRVRPFKLPNRQFGLDPVAMMQSLAR